MKKMMSDEFSDSIAFVPNPRIYESDIVFSSEITQAELAVKLNNLDVTKKIWRTTTPVIIECKIRAR